MEKTFKHITHNFFLTACILLGCMVSVDAASQTCEGKIFLKSGGLRTFVGDDRMEMPRKMHDVEAYRNFFSHQCQREVVPVDSIDSVAVWNAETPENARILEPVKGVGWCWRYADHPRMQVYVYSSQGYSLNALGGIKAHQGNTVAALFLIPSKTACDFYVVRQGEEPVNLGDVYKRCDKAFIRKLCRCAGIGADTERQLLNRGEVDRSAMVQTVVEMLGKK